MDQVDSEDFSGGVNRPAILDREAMDLALKLARAHQGRTPPNPMVGCVLVCEGRIVGQGAHRGVGCPHAERDALSQAGTMAKGATAFVTLEPCFHQGRTGPCAEALIRAGVGRVVIATLDPNPLVAGKGMALLKNAGIPVDIGLGEEAARVLIEPFAYRMRTGLPWIQAKWAMTIDGKIATRGGESQWITTQGSRARAAAMRGLVDAVVVGSGTVLADDPLLTARPPGPRTPTRVVLDRRGRVYPQGKLARSIGEGPILIIGKPGVAKDWIDGWRSRGAEVVLAEDSIEGLVGVAQSRGWSEVWVEGGGGLLGAFFEKKMIQELHVFVGSLVFGGVQAPGPVGGWGIESISGASNWALCELERLGDDVRLSYRAGSRG